MNSKIFSIIMFSIVLSFSCETSSEKQEKEVPAITKESIESVRDLVNFLKFTKEENHLKSFTFIQESFRYKDGEIVDTSIWHEAIEYPDKFRIDFGDLDAGNTNLYRADSIYMYRGGQLKQKNFSKQELLLMEGGIYYYTTDRVMKDLKGYGIDTTVLTKTNYEGRAAYIIGAKSWDEIKPQIWLDAEELHNIQRKTLQMDGVLYTATFYNHKKFDGFWIETGVDFFSPTGELLQREIYTNVKANPNLDPLVFDPVLSPKNHWLEN